MGGLDADRVVEYCLEGTQRILNNSVQNDLQRLGQTRVPRHATSHVDTQCCGTIYLLSVEYLN